MWQHWLADMLGGAVAKTSTMSSPPPRQQIGEALTQVMQKTTGGRERLLLDELGALAAVFTNG